MAQDVANPEMLHNVAKTSKQVAGSAWVNENTPSTPLVTLGDLRNPEVSKAATEKLKVDLIKDR